jgi:steroid 5-alpha reductase family enzyme
MTGILFAFLISLGVNAVFFAIAAMKKTDLLTDLSYSLSFLVITATITLAYRAFRPVQLVLAFLVVAWAVRLGGYRFFRMRRIGIDHRFDGIREKPLAFARFWLLQTCTAGIVMMPAVLVLSTQTIRHIGPWTVIGSLLWAGGFLLETLSDGQRSSFGSDPANEGKILAEGMWKYSRHPNYFGEILVWLGIFLYSIPSLTGPLYAAALGPVFITFLLVFVTGIPPHERAANERHGDDPAYREYKRRTSVLVPWFRGK